MNRIDDVLCYYIYGISGYSYETVDFREGGVRHKAKKKIWAKLSKSLYFRLRTSEISHRKK